MFRKSVYSEVPTLWREVSVVLVFKEGDQFFISNYSPVNVTSVVSKSLESVMSRSIRKHLYALSVIHDS